MSLTATHAAIHAWVLAASGLDSQHVVWEQQDHPRPSGPYISMLLRGIGEVGQPVTSVCTNSLTLDDDDVETVNVGADSLTLTGHAYVSGDGPVRFTTDGTLPPELAIDTDYWIIVLDTDTIQLAAKFVDSVNTPAPIVLSGAGTGTHTIEDTAETLRAGIEIVHQVHTAEVGRLTLQCFSGDPTGDASAVALLRKVLRGRRLPTSRDALRAANVSVLRTGDVLDAGAVIRSADFEPRAVVDVTLGLASTESETGTIIESVEIENQATGIIMTGNLADFTLEFGVVPPAPSEGGSIGSYMYGRMATNQNTNTGAGTWFEWDTFLIEGDGLSVSTGAGQQLGKITLTGGRTWEITTHCNMVLNNSQSAHQWFDDTTGLVITDAAGEDCPSMLNRDNNNTNETTMSGSVFLFKPLVDTTIRLQLTSGGAVLVSRTRHSHFKIVELA